MDLEENYGIQFDEDGRLVGFQAGKAAALLEWEHRKAAREFTKLCEKLGDRKCKSMHRARVKAAYARSCGPSAAVDYFDSGEIIHTAAKRHEFSLKNLTPEEAQLVRRIWARRVYHRRVSRGMCAYNGCDSPPTDGKTDCAYHRGLKCARMKARAERAKAEGRCHSCQKRPRQGTTARCSECKSVRKARGRPKIIGPLKKEKR